MKNPNIWKNVESEENDVHGESLKVFSEIGNIQCRLTFNDANSVWSTKFLKCIFEIEPACKKWQIQLLKIFGFQFSSFFGRSSISSLSHHLAANDK